MATSTSSVPPTKILACKCNHEYQDRKYGNGMRIHNFAPKAQQGGGYRCTVCGNVKSSGIQEATKSTETPAK